MESEVVATLCAAYPEVDVSVVHLILAEAGGDAGEAAAQLAVLAGESRPRSVACVMFHLPAALLTRRAVGQPSFQTARQEDDDMALALQQSRASSSVQYCYCSLTTHHAQPPTPQPFATRAAGTVGASLCVWQPCAAVAASPAVASPLGAALAKPATGAATARQRAWQPCRREVKRRHWWAWQRAFRTCKAAIPTGEGRWQRSPSSAKGAACHHWRPVSVLVRGLAR
jgi:hypothetical protein